MKEVKIYTIVSDQLSPPITGESFCTDMVRHSDYAELEAKCAALAAENELARKAVQAFCDVVGDNTEVICEEVGRDGVLVILEAMKATGNMPATDALLAEVRAQGVDMARNAMIDFVDGEVGPNKNVPGLIRGAEICVSIAEQLRKGGNQ
ncbi:hypothetical protein EH264_22215 [Salmonella enterica]|uniref:Ead/Ea22-like family protein n=2 Tax=Salmonella enterica TaxID=28901 RepID=A0A633I1T4_SALER|nr:hypothetical protein [Salmonella enterica]EAQ3278502.1 hypothetical protein [Salmonella enterica subsp. enterica]EDR4629447.1 hypothetical protein [Salmonella enterica subsp. enterica serovar 4,[5],12:i:-]EEB9973535.1 hypothetical protein [Salmonella enterica subsp. enterica serovar Poona]EAA3602419.1 hypothetical protein [Salmonella enterica subsp. enterica serovar Schwarzengrund]EAA5794128.1 hypothetical protein [Salmonella enterica]